MMRVDPDLYASVDSSIQQSEVALQTATRQLSSGLRVATPSDDPLAFANDIRSVASSAAIDTYAKNAAATLAQAQLADSTLSNIVTSLTQALSLGTEGGNGTLTSAQRTTLSGQVQSILSQVVSQANTTSNGSALFAGTAGVKMAFAPDASSSTGYSYQGNSQSNQTQVGDSYSVAVNIPGDHIFTSAGGNVLASLQTLAGALETGSQADLAAATSQVSAAVAHVDQIRAQYGSTVSELTAQNDYLSQETVSLTSQQTDLTGIDLATAATNLTQAQTAQSAVLAMAAKILPTSLLNYLQN